MQGLQSKLSKSQKHLLQKLQSRKIFFYTLKTVLKNIAFTFYQKIPQNILGDFSAVMFHKEQFGNIFHFTPIQELL